MRNLKKQRTKGENIIEKHKRADIGALELYQLIEIAREDPQSAVYNVACTAFYAGVACGYRLSKKDKKKER